MMLKKLIRIFFGMGTKGSMKYLRNIKFSTAIHKNKNIIFHSSKNIISLDDIILKIENLGRVNLILNLNFKACTPIILMAKEATYSYFFWEENSKSIKMLNNLFKVIFSYSNFSENELIQFQTTYLKNLKNLKDKKDLLTLPEQDEVSKKFAIIRHLSEAYIRFYNNFYLLYPYDPHNFILFSQIFDLFKKFKFISFSFPISLLLKSIPLKETNKIIERISEYGENEINFPINSSKKSPNIRELEYNLKIAISIQTSLNNLSLINERSLDFFRDYLESFLIKV